MLRVSLEIFRKGSILTVTSIANIVNARGIYMSNGTGLLVGVSLRRPLFGNSWFFHLHYILMCLCLLGGSGLQEVPALRGFKSPPDRIPAFHWILLWGFPLCVPPRSVLFLIPAHSVGSQKAGLQNDTPPLASVTYLYWQLGMKMGISGQFYFDCKCTWGPLFNLELEFPKSNQ